MNVRWHFLLLPFLAVCFALSTFEVDVDGIVTNTWGDAYDAYLPAAFTADDVTATTQSPQTQLGGYTPKWRVTALSLFRLPVRVFLSPLPVHGGLRWTYLRCCQLLI